MRASSHAFALAGALLLAALPAFARQKRPRVRYEDTRVERPSARYAALSEVACLRALSSRKIGFSRLDKARGVLAPVRLTGALGGVVFRSEAPEAERRSSPAEVYDCRLVLALHDWTKALAAHGIDEVRIASAWRPPKRSWPAGRSATRHSGALAVDVKRFGKKLGPGEKAKRWLSVEADFRGKIGAPVCRSGEDASKGPGGSAAKELRAIACEARDLRLFTSILTPNYDRAHRDHFHLELRPGVSWSLFL